MEHIKSNKSLAILLATYNSEKYLREQLNSLFGQTYQDWKLFVHDDGSSDNTLSIVKEYATKHSNIVILDFPPTGGAKSNFMHMLSCVEAEYYMFCDHDDVWINTKVELTLKKMKEAEMSFPNLPIIVHTDLYVVNENLQIVHPSFWKYEGIYPSEINTFEMLAAFNLTTGCTMMINARAKEVTPNDSSEVMMHDSWITAAVLWAKGKVVEIDLPLVLYRQHGDNCLGANQPHISVINILKNILFILNENGRRFRMLNKVGHISLFTYIKYKMLGRKKLLSYINKKAN